MFHKCSLTHFVSPNLWLSFVNACFGLCTFSLAFLNHRYIPACAFCFPLLRPGNDEITFSVCILNKLCTGADMARAKNNFSHLLNYTLHWVQKCQLVIDFIGAFWIQMLTLFLIFLLTALRARSSSFVSGMFWGRVTPIVLSRVFSSSESRRTGNWNE